MSKKTKDLGNELEKNFFLHVENGMQIFYYPKNILENSRKEIDIFFYLLKK